MVQPMQFRPVDTASTRPSGVSSTTAGAGWPDGAADQARCLHRSLTIGDRDWHALKTQRCRRGAEQLAAALVQLTSCDNPGSRQSTPARQEALALVEHALLWLRAEISDPGCPSHGR